MSGYLPIEGALGAVKTGFDLIKSVRELLKKDKVDANEVTSQLIKLQDLLLDARSALADAGDYVAKIEAELAITKRIEELEKLMVYDQSVYWKFTGDGSEREPDPYCPVCWDRDRRLSHLTPGATKGTYSCQIDETVYTTAEYRPGPPFAMVPMGRY